MHISTPKRNQKPQPLLFLSRKKLLFSRKKTHTFPLSVLNRLNRIRLLSSTFIFVRDTFSPSAYFYLTEQLPRSRPFHVMYIRFNSCFFSRHYRILIMKLLTSQLICPRIMLVILLIEYKSDNFIPNRFSFCSQSDQLLNE